MAALFVQSKDMLIVPDAPSDSLVFPILATTLSMQAVDKYAHLTDALAVWHFNLQSSGRERLTLLIKDTAYETFLYLTSDEYIDRILSGMKTDKEREFITTRLEGRAEVWKALKEAPQIDPLAAASKLSPSGNQSGMLN
jgi:hypothetical protein